MVVLDSPAVAVLEVIKGALKRSCQTHLLKTMQVVPTVLILPPSIKAVLSEEGSIQRQCILGFVEREHQVAEAAQPESRPRN